MEDMVNFWWGFVGGLFVGATVGVVIAGLLHAATHRNDEPHDWSDHGA
jgi:hypothetical protein